MRRLIVVMLLVAAFVAPGPASGRDFGIQSCSQAKVTLYEHQNGTGNTLVVCFPEAVFDLPDWIDNKTSKAVFEEFTTDTAVCLYGQVGYIPLLWKGSNNGDTKVWNWWNPGNDDTTSVKFGANCG